MTSRPPSPDTSRSDVAAILMAMSQTRPQGIEFDCKTLRETAENIGRRSAAFPTLGTKFNSVAKASNSEDDEMDIQVSVAQCKPSVNRDSAPNSSGSALYAREALPVPVVSSRYTIPSSSHWATCAGGTVEADLPQSVPSYSPSFVMSGDEPAEMSSSARARFGWASLTDVDLASQLGTIPGPRSRVPSLMPPDIVECFLVPSSSSIETRVAYSPAPLPMRFQYAGQPLYESSVMPRPRNIAMNISRHMARPEPETEIRTDVTDLAVEHARPAHQRPGRALPTSPAYVAYPRAAIDTQATLESAPAENTKIHGRMRIPWLPRKHAISPPRDDARKRQRDGFGPKEIDITDFKYRTIKAIQMPARDDVLPGQDPPEPTTEDLPYGDDIDFQTSMLLYWLDEKELTYTECARRFRTMFSGETATDDTIRKKHHAALIKLVRKYGMKPEDEIEEPSKSVVRRGQQAGHKYNTIGGKVIYSAGASPDVAGTSRRKRIGEPTANRGFLKACICVWKDTSDVSFSEIQQRLARDYSWHIGTNTVQKLYYQERGRVYDTYDDKGKGAGQRLGTKETVKTDDAEVVEAAETEDEDPSITAT
ncbi:hypothetical protein SVAN01_10434 [Stagonosporopsis vannaccii]|nr:hypothetical protein SVAN01_10434 [Stagonosporopsis vannaccii]